MSHVLDFELPGLPKMLNKTRVHWRRVYLERQKWKSAVWNAVRLQKERAALEFLPLAHAKVTITRCSSTQPDYDGLVSGGKALLDGLVEAGVIVDDKMSVIGQPVYLWERAPQRQGKVRIRVEAVKTGVKHAASEG